VNIKIKLCSLFFFALLGCNAHTEKQVTQAKLKKEEVTLTLLPLTSKITWEHFCREQKIEKLLWQDEFKKEVPKLNDYTKVRIHNQSDYTISFYSVGTVLYQDIFYYYQQERDFPYGAVFFNARDNDLTENTLKSKQHKDFYVLYPNAVDSMLFALKYRYTPRDKVSDKKGNSISCKLVMADSVYLKSKVLH
jgi:hypothetical protein